MKLLSNSYQHEINSSHLKMARVPSSVKMAFGKDPLGKPSCFPLISVHNINKSGLPQSRKNQKKTYFFKVRDDCVNELHIIYIISWKFRTLLGSQLKVGTLYSLLSHQVSENISLCQHCFKDRIVRYLSLHYLP